jgi:hypothetical protein
MCKRFEKIRLAPPPSLLRPSSLFFRATFVILSKMGTTCGEGEVERKVLPQLLRDMHFNNLF